MILVITDTKIFRFDDQFEAFKNFHDQNEVSFVDPEDEMKCIMDEGDESIQKLRMRRFSNWIRKVEDYREDDKK